MLSRSKVAALIAEFLGTATLAMVAIILTETTAAFYFIATSLWLTLIAIVLVFGNVSGAHVNPAITFGMWTARKISSLRAIGYIAAQMLGGVAAWQLYQYLIDKPLIAKTPIFSTRIWLAEAIGTFVLALGFTVAYMRRLESLQAGFAYGAALFTGIIIATIASAGLLNPALALGLRSWGTAYVLGPLVGALVGVNLYTLLLDPKANLRFKQLKIKK